ncbi:MAG: mannose-6-phosphate isomerase [Frankiales bacterium]|nr:mannose-6-phosphate isomerase [Frankiales bacterium]
MGCMDLLTNAIQPYAWGSHSAIAGLQGREPSAQPEAELWMGAHPGAPSRLNRAPTLLDAIERAPREELGDAVVEAFGVRLPYLLKVLAADRPLSLQVHPSSGQARAGFDAEEARGLPRDAPDRNYRDPYSKPELIVALTPFVGLCGFRDATELAELLDELAVPALKEFADNLAARPDEASVRGMLASLLRWPEHQRAALVAEVVHACERRGPGSRFAATYEWAVRVAGDYPGDTGVVVVLMLNLVSLAPGEAVFLRPRTLHAYLKGVGVEILAGSDNVLRGGLTPKHIDVDELLGVLEFSHGPVQLTPAEVVTPVEQAWVTPTPEFRLSRLLLTGEAVRLEGGSPQILLCTQGTVRLQEGGEVREIGGGESIFLPASSAGVQVSGEATVFRAKPGL